MEEEVKTIKKISELSKEDIEEFLAGYRSILAGVAETIEGLGRIKKIEDENGIPLLQDDFFETLSELIESEEFKEAVKKTESERVLGFFRMIFSMLKIIRKLESFDPRVLPYNEILNLSKDLRKFVEDVDKFLEEIKET
ncbi:hypothetical protein DRP05_14815 [Archaeoglobales archaeon]|nr:MAG: hypothetical protein DRP05_14815 [Archaeoglobales archaeon]